MKQSSDNTFSGGLNFDLNPITTPNNILTDALNATFISFNGDELALQNDAGNTKINVLYETEVLYDPEASYAKGSIVVDENAQYYKNLTGNNSSGLSTTDWENMTYVHLAKDFYPIGIKEYGGVLYIVSTDGDNVEFGSYPSPEYLTNTNSPGIDFMYDETMPNNPWYKDILYKPVVIHDDDFKAGRYVIFDLPMDEICYLLNISSAIPRFYIMKLWQILDNGVLDLTNDIANKYRRYNIDTFNILEEDDHWFNDPQFKYFCPGQYKGRLAVSLEIEPLKTFKLETTPELTYDNIGEEYIYTFDVSALGYGYITITSVVVKVWTEDSEASIDTVVTVTPDTNTFTFSMAFDKALKDTLIRYQVEPNFTVRDDNGVLTEYDHTLGYFDFPEEYRSQYIITGQRLLTTIYDAVKFRLESANCVDGYFNRIVLINNDGALIDNELELVLDSVKYVFIENSTTTTDHIIAKYVVVNGKPVIIDNIDNLVIDEGIIAFLENTLITTKNSDCGKSVVTVNTNIPISILGLADIVESIDLLQPTSITPFYISPDYKQFKYNVNNGVPFTLTVGQNATDTWEGYNTNTYTKTITSDTTINHAFIARFHLASTYTDGIYVNGSTNVIWQSGYDLGALDIRVFSVGFTMNYNNITSKYVSVELAKGSDYVTVTVSEAVALSNNWSNIVNNNEYRELLYNGNTFIFAKKYKEDPNGTLATHFLDYKDLVVIGDSGNNFNLNMGFNSERQLLALHTIESITWAIVEGEDSATILDGLVTTTGIEGQFTVRAEIDAYTYDEVMMNNSLYIDTNNEYIITAGGSPIYLTAIFDKEVTWDMTITNNAVLHDFGGNSASVTPYIDVVSEVIEITATEIPTSSYIPAYSTIEITINE